MTSWREWDFRHDWVSVTLDALETGFARIQEMGEELDWFDGLWQLEHAESIMGIAFVTAQAYILGAVEDVNDIREGSGKTKLRKIEYYSDDPNPLSNGVSRILLINSIANYYKHHDEWGKTWKENATTKNLSQIGIVETTEFPCHVAATELWGDKGCENLENLLTIISEWREHILSKYK
jgi:hypothetical protein